MNRRKFLQYGALFLGVGGFCFLHSQNEKNILENISLNNTDISKTPCRVPFEFCEIIEGGNVLPCCQAYMKKYVSFGNIYNQNFDKIWNSKTANDFRRRILKGDFSLCERKICHYKPLEDIESIKDYKLGPKNIKLSYDYECNYRCITCRDEIVTNPPNQLELYNEELLPKLLEIAPNAEIIGLSGSGDPLVSSHSRRVLKEICKKNPKIKFDLFSQGYLLDEKNLTELGIINNLREVAISLDSTTKETYEKILRIDAFDRVMKNLKFVSKLKQQGKVKKFVINCVVHSMNYKEMYDFAKLAESLDAIAFFSTYQPWPSAEMHKRYSEVAVFEPYHKDYNELKEILHNPIFLGEHCTLNSTLLQIALS